MNYVGRDPSPGSFVFPAPTSQAGRLVQSAAHVRTDFLSLAVAIPLDDTIPQIGEGAEYFSIAAFAPLFIGSRVRISLLFCGSGAGVAGMIMALFRAGTPDALAVAMTVNPAANNEGQVKIDYEFIAASLAPFTYSVRGGSADGTAVRLNGRGVREFGGTYTSYLRIDEYTP